MAASRRMTPERSPRTSGRAAGDPAGKPPAPAVRDPKQPGRRRRGRYTRLDARLRPAERILLAAGVFLLLGLAWWAITAAGLVQPLFLPGPAAVWRALVAQAQNGELASDIAISVTRIMLGFALATVMAVPVGIMMGRFRVLDALFEPLVDFIRYMPVVAFVPLTVVWAGVTDVQKVLIIWLGTFFPMVLLIMDDVRRVPAEYVDIGRSFGMRDGRILRRIILRASLPSIWDTMRICIGWAWSWLVLGELVAATSGLGYRITVGQRYLETDLIIAYVLVLGILGLITDQSMRLAHRAFFGYMRKGGP
jgi:NitT/TauT family transport system permease protein